MTLEEQPQQHVDPRLQGRPDDPGEHAPPGAGRADPDHPGSHLKGFVNAGYGLIQGLGLTLKNLFRPPVTIQYPEERYEVPLTYRGVPVLVTDPETGELKCVGCRACERACPPQVISIETSRRVGDPKRKLNIDAFRIDMTRCMECNLCVEACPFDALAMSPHYELGDYEAEGLVLDKEELAAIYEATGGVGPAGQHWSPRRWMPVGPDTDD